MEIYFKTLRSADMQEVTPRITAVATQKLNSLKKYLGDRKNIAKVFVELRRDSAAHHNGSIWRTKINLDCDGRRYHADSTQEKLEVSLGASIRELEQELRKAKTRKRTMAQRDGGLLKDLIRGFRTP